MIKTNIIKKNWYVKFSDSKHAKKVTCQEFAKLTEMGVFYNAIVKNNSHLHGKTLELSFTKNFVYNSLYKWYNSRL